MTKAVRSIARSVGNVIGGAVKAVKGVVSGAVKAVKTFAKSKIGKVIIMAAAIYFGGAALMGGFGSAAGSGASGFLSGMGTGVANAATSLSQAWGSATSLELGKAGSQLSAGFQGSTAALQAASAAPTATTGLIDSAINAGAKTATNVAADTAAKTGVDLAAKELAAKLAAEKLAAGGWANGMVNAAKITAGTQLIGGLVQGAGAQKAQEDQRKYEADQAVAAYNRHNANVGANLWGESPSTGYAPPGPRAFTYDPVAEARAIGERSRAEFEARYGNGPAQTGMIRRNMDAAPMTNNNFPVYNPANYRG